jgi:anti-sigma factor RsiW
MSAAGRFDELVSSWLDETLDPEGIAELDALLVAKPDYARRFVRIGRLHAGLRELQAPPAAPEAPSRSLLDSIRRWWGGR